MFRIRLVVLLIASCLEHIQADPQPACPHMALSVSVATVLIGWWLSILVVRYIETGEVTGSCIVTQSPSSEARQTQVIQDFLASWPWEISVFLSAPRPISLGHQ